MSFGKIAAGTIAAAVMFGSLAATMEPSFAAGPMKPMASKTFACKKGEVAYKVKVGHKWVWRCHVVPHHHTKVPPKPLHKKP